MGNHHRQMFNCAVSPSNRSDKVLSTPFMGNDHLFDCVHIRSILDNRFTMSEFGYQLGSDRRIEVLDSNDLEESELYQFL
jgi:hypothetical protein